MSSPRSCLSVLLILALGAAAAPAADPPEKATTPPTAMRQFAASLMKDAIEHNVSELRYEEPYLQVSPKKLMYFSFGKIDAQVSPELLLQLRIELLRQLPIFDHDRTAQLAATLERSVVTYIRLKDDYDNEKRTRPAHWDSNGKAASALAGQLAQLQGEFQDALIDATLHEAQDKMLSVSPAFALRLSDKYYFGGAFVDRQSISFESMKLKISRYFEKGLVEYVTPYKIVHRDPYSDRATVQFERGWVKNGPTDNPTIAAMLDLELMRRYPDIDPLILNPYLDRLEEQLHQRFEWERQSTLKDIKEQGSPDMRPIDDARRAYADKFGLVIAEHMVPDSALVETGIVFKAASDVKRIIIVPTLIYRLAALRKRDVSVLDQQILAPGDSRNISAGKYVYRLETSEGQTTDYKAFSIPEDLDGNGTLTLR